MATYYIAPAPLGSDLNDGLAPETPFENVQTAVDLIPTGGLMNDNYIYLLDGTYIGQTVASTDKSFSLSAEFGAVTLQGSGGTFLQFVETMPNSAGFVIQDNFGAGFTIQGYTYSFDIQAQFYDGIRDFYHVFQAVSMKNQKIKTSLPISLQIFNCDLSGVEFELPTDVPLRLLGGQAISDCNLTNTKGVVAFCGQLFNYGGTDYVSAFFSNNTCKGTEITISDVAGEGYTHAKDFFLPPYYPNFDSTTNNNFTGAKVRFFNSATDTLADISGLAYKRVYTLGAMQNKAVADLGSGIVLEPTSFLFDAPELYTAPSGNDTTGNGTAANPYYTIRRAAQDIPSGAARDEFTIKVGQGTYIYLNDGDGGTDGKACTVDAYQGDVDFDGITAYFAQFDCTTPNTAAARYTSSGGYTITFDGVWAKLFDLIAPAPNTATDKLFTFENCVFQGAVFSQPYFNFFEFINCDFTNALFNNTSGELVANKAIHTATGCDFTSAEGFALYGSASGVAGVYSGNKLHNATFSINTDANGLSAYAIGQGNLCSNLRVRFAGSSKTFATAPDYARVRNLTALENKAILDVMLFDIGRGNFIFTPEPTGGDGEIEKVAGATPRPTLGNLREKEEPPFAIAITKPDGTTHRMYLSAEPNPQWGMGIDGDVGDINTTVTNSFTIAKNYETDKIFEIFTNFNQDSNIYKENLSVSLLYKNEILIEKAKIKTFSDNNKSYSLELASDNAILLDLAKNKLKDLDLSAYNFIYGGAPDFTQSAADVIFFKFYGKLDTTTTANLMSTPPPAVRLKTLFDEILDQNGLTAVYPDTFNFYQSADFSNRYIQLGSFKIDTANSKAVPKYSYGTSVAGTYYIVPTNTTDNDFILFAGSEIDVQAKNTYKFTAQKIFNSGKHTLFLEVDGTTEYEILQADATTEYTISLNINQKVRLKLVKIGSGISRVDYQITVVATDATTAINGRYFISPNLPDISQVDLIKFVAKRYGLLVDFDPEANTIIFKRLDDYELNFNSGGYIDITDYLVNQSTATVDRVGANAQVNFYNYKNDSNIDVAIGQGQINYTNANVEPTRVAYEAPLSLSVTNGLGIIAIDAVDEAGAFKEFAPRFVSALGLTGAGGTMYYAAQHYAKEPENMTYNCEWQPTLNEYYKPNFRNIENFKLLSVKVNMPFKIFQKIKDKYSATTVLINSITTKYGQISGFFKLVDSTFRHSAPSDLKLLLLNFEVTDVQSSDAVYLWDSSQSILESGLVRVAPQMVATADPATLAEQAAVANQPQHGYYKPAEYTADTVPSGAVATWSNNQGYGLPALAQGSAGQQPTKVGDFVEMGTNKFMGFTQTAVVINMLTVEMVFKCDNIATISAGNSFQFSQQLAGGTNGFALAFNYLNATTIQAQFYGYNTLGAIVVIKTQNFTLSQFNAQFNSETTVRFSFINNSGYLKIGSTVYPATFSGLANINITAGTKATVILNTYAQKFYLKSISKYHTYVSENLPLPTTRQGFVSESGDYLTAALPTGIYSKATAGVWVKYNPSYNPTADNIHTVFGTLSGNNGFSFVVSYNNTTSKFSVIFFFADGYTSDFAKKEFTKTEFLSIFAGRWVFLAGAFGFGTKQIFIDSTAYPTEATMLTRIVDSTTPTATIGSAFAPTGLAIERPFYSPMIKFDQEAFLAKKANDISVLPYLNN